MADINDDYDCRPDAFDLAADAQRIIDKGGVFANCVVVRCQNYPHYHLQMRWNIPMDLPCDDPRDNLKLTGIS